MNPPAWLGLRRVSRAERRRLLYRQAWCAALGGQALLAAAWLYPVDLARQGLPAILAFWAAFLLRLFTWHLALAFLVLALAALVRRCRLLALAASPGALLFLALTGGILWPARPPPGAGRPLKVVSLNLLMINDETAPTIAFLRAEDPDLIVFQEYTELWNDELEEALGERYPHRVCCCREDSFGAAVFSRLPFVEVSERLPGAVQDLGLPEYRVTFRHEGRLLALYDVHTLPPRLPSYVRVQRRQFQGLLRSLEAETVPVLLTGDFNWNEYSWYHRQLLARGLREGHALAGRWRGATWPRRPWLLRLLPGFRLDHIYLSPGLTCLEHRPGPAGRSDHRPLVARIALAP